MTYFLSGLGTQIARFFRSEKGYVTLETLIVLPVLIWTVAGTLSYYDIFRTKNMFQKAAYTVSNIITRTRMKETLPASAFKGYYDLINYLTYQDDEVSIRVTLYTYNGSTKKYVVQYSCPVGSYTSLKLTDTTLNLMAGNLPKMAPGDFSILLEAWSNYKPIIDLNGFITGDVSNNTMHEFIPTRPRAGIFYAVCP